MPWHSRRRPASTDAPPHTTIVRHRSPSIVAGGHRLDVDRTIAYGHAIARVAIGAGIATAPRRWLGRDWFGEHSNDPATRIAMRGMGARELALGAAILRDLVRGGSARELFALCAAAELVDIAGSLAGPPSFRRSPATRVSALALSAVLSGIYLASRGHDQAR